MIKKKIIGACFIFLILFAGAWKVDNANKRVFINTIPIEPQLSDIMPTQVHFFNKQPIEFFKPREYVRILGLLEEVSEELLEETSEGIFDETSDDLTSEQILN